MTTATINTQLDNLGLSGFKAALVRQSEDANYTQLTFEERLYQLLESESVERNNRRIKRLMSQAKLKDTQAVLDQLEYGSKRGVERSVVLSLANNEYIAKGQNVLITGATGVGYVKSTDM
jgi:DNA replication protein DnaC